MKRTSGMIAALALVFACGAWPATAAETGAPAPSDSIGRDYASLARTDSLILAALDRMRGVIPGADSLVAWKVFEAHPRRTVVLLMPGLRSIPRGLSLGAPNMVWRVRVLQRLTGLSFRGRTKARLRGEEREWLAPDSLGRVPFAGENAARGMTWVAPRDAQREILEQWHAWWEGVSLSTPLPVRDRSRDRKDWWH